MEAILPFLLCFVLPVVWTAVVFVAGRWSATHSISVQRRGDVANSSSPYYEGFEEV